MPIHNEILEAGQKIIVMVHHSGSHELRMGTLIAEVEHLGLNVSYWSFEYDNGIVDIGIFSQSDDEFGVTWGMDYGL